MAEMRFRWPLYIEPGSPWENGYCESFNGKMRSASQRRDVLHTQGTTDHDGPLENSLQHNPSAQQSQGPEITDPKNDFNLNFPRYIDSTEPEDLQDIDRHLRGGISRPRHRRA
jgi:hypothetical protein